MQIWSDMVTGVDQIRIDNQRIMCCYCIESGILLYP